MHLKRRTKAKKKFQIVDRQLRALLHKGGRKGARKDFFELLKRTVRPKSDKLIRIDIVEAED